MNAEQKVYVDELFLRIQKALRILRDVPKGSVEDGILDGCITEAIKMLDTGLE